MINRKIIGICRKVTVVALLLCPFASNAEIPRSPIPFYAGVGLGSSSYDYPNNDLESRSVDKSGFYYQLFAGYSFNEYFAIEAGYAVLSELEETIEQEFAGTTDRNVELYRDSTISVDGFRLNLKGSLPINRHFSLYAKAGLFRWNSDHDTVLTVNYFDPEIEDIDRRESVSDSGTDGHYAIGVEGRRDRLSVFIEHELYETETENIYGVNVGIHYVF
ncbi:outer membrane beta-barrel protein [Thalassotalea sp. PS06]|uniref:outer membrane beta-barrel protein n=1 Tax=Thalassotalea sp. PS06 TaxID=2594005 RepID=UPI0011639A59|nr:outer membrane beta-barrel protein [Thalassotalea sp. PS06]QDP02312.1 porin family protein [Thalassotalea sp. PS06]